MSGDLGELFAELGELEFDDENLIQEEGEGDEDDYGDGEELTPEQVAEYLANKEERRCEPVPYKMRPTKKRIAVVDTETDPFEFGVVVKPFTLGFDTGDRYVDFWGDDCVKQFFEYLATLDEEFVIYAHNGGKFDFFFFLDYLDAGQTPLIMGGRLVKVFFQGQEFRDSFAILPQALKGYKKDDIDYAKMHRDKREKHKEEIRSYQRGDCQYAMDLIVAFHDMFGDKLTVASASLCMLNSLHGFEKINSDMLDERFRRYYYGGRNQCFETGVTRPSPGKTWKVVDRNSMYSAEMLNTLHPISNRFTLQDSIKEDTDFALIVAKNYGALPRRHEDGSLDFTCPRGEFYATIHEIRAGLDTGTLVIERVKHAWAFDRKATFGEFVTKFYTLREESKANGDLVRNILYKFNLNSPYGKFALNPRKFKQWAMTIGEVPGDLRSTDNPGGWSLHSQSGNLFIWSRPSPRKGGFYNVATAASITGAARANLLRNLSLATRPIYCDTDSIICEDFGGEMGERLGEWKLEAEGNVAAIAGKKLYTVFDDTSPEWINEGKAVKRASKGVRLEPRDIVRVCRGQEIVHRNDAPTFYLDGTADFMTRTIRATGKAA